jgi:hypothetical protein
VKKTMKFLFLSLAASLFLVSCGTSSGNTSASNSVTSSETSAPSDDTTIAYADKTVTATKLVTYPGPSLLTTSAHVGITVNGHELFVYETRVNHARKFKWDCSTDYNAAALFDFEGRVHVEVTIKDESTLQSALVRPLSIGPKTTISGNKIAFDLEYTGNYVIEYNGNADQAIHLFANPIETNPISADDAKKDSNIVYIGPGIYNAGAIPTGAGKTIYLAGGAYVYGQIRAEGIDGLTIRGRGIIDGSIYERRSESEYTIPVVTRNVSNLVIEDIAFFDPAGWVLNIYKCTNVTINNVKIISARANSDGISIQSCSHVRVNGGFVRSWDDSLVVKNVDRGTTSDVVFDGVSVWTDLAQSMEVGYETNGATMDGITFKNITVFHNYHKAAMSIHNSDDAQITNVTYENITIEDGQMLGDVRDDGENDFLIDLTIAYSVDWTKSAGERGSIDGVKFTNVKVLSLADSIVSRMNGESASSMIKNVTIEGMKIEGKIISQTSDLGLLSNQYVEGVSVKSTASVSGAVMTLPYHLALTSDSVDYTAVSGVSQEGLLVPSFAIAQGGTAFIGVKASGTFSASATHSAGTTTSTPADDGSGDNSASDHSVALALDGDATTYWESKAWMGVDNEFAALSVDLGGLVTVGVIRLLGKNDNAFYYDYGFQVWGRKIKSDGTTNPNFTRLLSLKDYEMTPASNNAIDINLTAQKFAGLQIRFYKQTSIAASKNIQIGEIEFYPPSLSFNKAIVDSTAHNDVYNVEKLVDGDPTGTSYYESSSLPAKVVIDLGDVYSVSVIVLSLPPSLLWDPRTENIEIDTSDSSTAYSSTTTAFTTAVAAKDYRFDPATGNRNLVTFTTPISLRFLKLVINSNDIAGGYNAQLSEVSVYGA